MEFRIADTFVVVMAQDLKTRGQMRGFPGVCVGCSVGNSDILGEGGGDG